MFINNLRIQTYAWRQFAIAPRAGACRKPGGYRQVRWLPCQSRAALTVLVVTAALAMSAVPAKDLRLALPDNGTAPAGAGADLLAEGKENAGNVSFL